MALVMDLGVSCMSPLNEWFVSPYLLPPGLTKNGGHLMIAIQGFGSHLFNN